MTPSWSEPPSGRVSSDTLTESDRFRLLSAKRRRLILELLSESTAPVVLEELAAAVRTREDEPGERDGDVAVALHHVHLPMLADLGVIDYDPSSKRIRAWHGTDDLLDR